MNSDLDRALNLFYSAQYLEAIPLLKQLAEQEIPDALGTLGCAYQVGLGIERDGERAVFLLQRAVELDHGASAHNLGTVYATGLPGIAPNHEKSRDYYRLARSLGFQVAPDDFYE